MNKKLNVVFFSYFLSLFVNETPNTEPITTIGNKKGFKCDESGRFIHTKVPINPNKNVEINMSNLKETISKRYL
ncbi:hypothetical protein BpHYR1_005725 [Brachionus plicatilis]|uniref:Uncharacterized protein n=1 Tax=Brachionus plicatilis TaxID=10195 RepID=A0A3M7S1K8_BRAPC|nr:hypothetical protein BpHYR1_005725 [Brachionus plicatilis]